jgi:DNA-binding NtrC family response regulator
MRVRVMATSSHNLGECVARGTFLRELSERLVLNEIALPPLRERVGDVEPLLAHFLAEITAEAMPVLADDAIEALTRYAWPGNVAELETVVAHLALVSRSRVVRAADLPLTAGATPLPGLALGAQLADLEREHIQAVLRQTRWHRGRAAAALGISSKTLYRKIREYGFVRPSHS